MNTERQSGPGASKKLRSRTWHRLHNFLFWLLYSPVLTAWQNGLSTATSGNRSRITRRNLRWILNEKRLPSMKRLPRAVSRDSCTRSNCSL
ncbi:uncharacterized protein BCR38DRAFT_435320 [Pseudomassariella vexata]|uniref:Uncharacterized protein n=1 Tax=Pseudomassariella vexata TaxID=1141098 RepID=A0A1Y2DZH3_9PEZI|nr:uncharacterized protein BCR38DRAFT_435320 [Pseudomassariella vexata]ORY64504.1 hypothetical protein BCR38DRAFT_435320 [Pseudomassariella vexata]